MVESVFAMVFVVTLLLGTLQIVLTVYARNVVQAAAQEAARSAVDRGGSEAFAASVAHRAIDRAAGRLLARREVLVERSSVSNGVMVRVSVAGRLRPLGPAPMHLPVTAIAHAFTEDDPR